MEWKDQVVEYATVYYNRRDFVTRHAASKDSSMPDRYKGVLLETDGSTVATNGHILINVNRPDQIGKRDKRLLMSLPEVEDARKLLTKKSAFESFEHSLVEEQSEEFPTNWRAVIPRLEPEKVVYIDVEYLERVCKAAREYATQHTTGAKPRLKMSLYGAEHAIKFEGSTEETKGFTAVVMPCIVINEEE